MGCCHVQDIQVVVVIIVRVFLTVIIVMETIADSLQSTAHTEADVPCSTWHRVDVDSAMSQKLTIILSSLTHN